MNVHVPETGNHELSARIEDPGLLRHARLDEFADRLNAITANYDPAVWRRWLTSGVDDGHVGERERVGLRRGVA